MGLGRPVGGGGFSGGHSSGSHSSHSSSNGGLLSGIIIGSLLSRNSGGSSGGVGQNNGDGAKYRRVRNQKATIVVSAILLAITIALVVLSVVFRFDAVYGEVQGHCLSHRYASYDNCYFHKYKYTVDGEEYINESKQGWEGYLEDDELDQMLYYKKSNPMIIYEKRVDEYNMRPSSNVLYIIFAVIFGLATIFVYLVGVNKYEIDPAYIEEQKRKAEEKQMEGKRKCSYCGTVMDAKDNKCPNCGANLK